MKFGNTALKILTAEALNNAVDAIWQHRNSESHYFLYLIM